MRISHILAAVGLAALLASSLASPVAAQNKIAQPTLAQAAAAGPSQLTVPPAEKLVLLIRLSLLTLNDAILTGNYSVLRDRGGPSFRQANSAAGLARIFTTLEAQRPDLAAVAVLTPQLSEAEIVGPEQRLHIRGHFPMQPMQVNFELMFEPAEGQWQLFGLSVGAVSAQVQAAPAAAAAAPVPSKPAAEAPPKAAPSKPASPKPPAAKK